MILFFSDINGLDDDKKAQLKAAFATDTIFVSPYDHLLESGFDKNYESFCDLVGMDKYIEVVKQQLEVMKTPFVAIGESVGATALWCNTTWLSQRQCRAAICLYGSRIRNHLDVQPNCPTHLYFSEDEAYFLTPEVTEQLIALNQVSFNTANLPHGYATPKHLQFNSAAFDRFSDFIKRLCDGDE